MPLPNVIFASRPPRPGRFCFFRASERCVNKSLPSHLDGRSRLLMLHRTERLQVEQSRVGVNGRVAIRASDSENASAYKDLFQNSQPVSPSSIGNGARNGNFGYKVEPARMTFFAPH